LRQLTTDTAVKLTTARYYTPKNRAIQARGITPDLLVDETAEGDGLNGLRVREADLQKHLGNDKEPEQASKRDVVEDEQRIAALSKKWKPVEFGSKDDFQLVQALNHFKGLPVQLSKADAKPASDVGETKADTPEKTAPVKTETPLKPDTKAK